MEQPERVIRPVTAADFDQSLALGREAFGGPPPGAPIPTAEGYPYPGHHAWGAFEGGRLLARVVGRDFHSWFSGVEVPTCGIAGVTVVAEHRGQGLLDDLFAAVLAEAAARGDVVSTLFPTAPGIYRRYGYELVGSFDTVEVPAAELLAVRPPTGVTTRRATPRDVPDLRRVYDAWAAAQNGPLTRRGASFLATDEGLLAEFTGVSLAVDGDGRVVGYASWDRGRGYGSEAVIEVADLLALTPDGHRALWRLLGSFAPVAPRVRVATSGDDVARLVLPSATWARVELHPYMLRILDVPGALSARPLTGEADVSFAVAGDRFGTTDGGYRLRVAGGAAECVRSDVGPEAPVFTPAGLAMAYAGAQSCGSLRLAGHLTGGSPAGAAVAGPAAGFDATFDALLGGRQVHIRDYF